MNRGNGNNTFSGYRGGVGFAACALFCAFHLQAPFYEAMRGDLMACKVIA